MAQTSHLRLSRRQFLQRTALVGAATLGMTALAGCPAAAPQAGGGAAAPGAANEEVLFWKPPHSEKEADLWKPLLEKFTSETEGITIDHQVIPWGSVDEQFTAAFACSDRPWAGSTLCEPIPVNWFGGCVPPRRTSGSSPTVRSNLPGPSPVRFS